MFTYRNCNCCWVDRCARCLRSVGRYCRLWFKCGWSCRFGWICYFRFNCKYCLIRDTCWGSWLWSESKGSFLRSKCWKQHWYWANRTELLCQNPSVLKNIENESWVIFKSYCNILGQLQPLNKRLIVQQCSVVRVVNRSKIVRFSFFLCHFKN